MASASAAIKVEIEFKEEDRTLLQNILYALEGFGQDKPSPEPGDGPELTLGVDDEATPADDESESDEFQELSKKAHAKAKTLLDTKDPDKIAIVKAALEKVGLERVTHMTTVAQVKAFTKALG